MQIVAPAGTVELHLVDLSAVPEQERDVELHRLLQRRLRARVRPERRNVLRPWLIKLGDDDHVFFYVMHHVATDGYSRAVLHDDLTELYEAALERREPRLPPLDDPVRGLRRLAPRLARRRRSRPAAHVLEADAGPGAVAARAPDRQAAPRRPRLPGRPYEPRALDGSAPPARERRPGGRRDAVHRAPEPLCGSAPPLLGPGRHRHRHAVRRTQPARARVDDRLLHQSARAPRRRLRRSVLQRAAERGRARRHSAPSPTPTSPTRWSSAPPRPSATSARRRCSR